MLLRKLHNRSGKESWEAVQQLRQKQSELDKAHDYVGRFILMGGRTGEIVSTRVFRKRPQLKIR